VGTLRRELGKRGVPMILNCALTELIVEEGRVAGVVVDHNGFRREIRARRGVALAAGGYERDQGSRDAFLAVPGDAAWSMAPEGGNTGDALRAARAIGAEAEFLDRMWWMPVVRLPSPVHANHVISHGMAFDQLHPFSLIVNRAGVRFANECISYDRFGIEMIRDGQATPCWLVFDAEYRRRYPCGGLMPNIVMPDWRVPPDWWDNSVFRADTVETLADKMGLPADALAATVMRFNGFAKTGEDPDFGRGSTAFDRAKADAKVKPNGCLGPVERAPFYAVRLDLGDLGSKGGLKCDEHARVVGKNGPIPGLYAAGNSAASPFADCYPGAGGTIGPALAFGYIAADHAAQNRREI
jgi:3-oxosteroid 1-dehydrogenase